MRERYYTLSSALYSASIISEHTGMDMAVRKVSAGAVDYYTLIERDAIAGAEADNQVVAIIAATVLPNTRSD